jgi:hypothetical protein
MFGLCCEVPSTVKKKEKKIKVHPLFGLCCEVPSTIKKQKKKNQGAPFPPSDNQYNINPGPSPQ